MGVAAYNRGSRRIREDIDREIMARRILKPDRKAEQGECERCFGPLGVRLDRGCTWNKIKSKWMDVCFSCKREMNRLD